MSDVKLLPCPFCGGEAEIERLGDSRQSTIYSCTDCGCRLETSERWEHGGQWNARPAPALTPKQEAADEMFDALETINRLTSPGGRTLDDFMRDMGLACDIARGALAKAGRP